MKIATNLKLTSGFETAEHFGVQGYKRYGGLVQTYPLTQDERLYDDTCKHIDELEQVMLSKAVSVFTVGELMALMNQVSRVHFFPKQEHLDRQKQWLTELLATVNSRGGINA